MACRVNAVALLAADAESGLLTVPLRQTRRLCLTMGSADRHLSARLPSCFSLGRLSLSPASPSFLSVRVKSVAR